MYRDMTKQIKEGEEIADKNTRLDLAASDFYRIMEEVKREADNYQPGDLVYYAIAKAYYAGLAIGYRNGRKNGRR